MKHLIYKKQNKSDFSFIFTHKTRLNKSKTTILKYLFLSKIQAKNLTSKKNFSMNDLKRKSMQIYNPLKKKIKPPKAVFSIQEKSLLL